MKYTFIPSPKRVSLNEEEQMAIDAAPTVEELQKKIRESEGKPIELSEEQKVKSHVEIEAEINPTDVSF